MARIAGQHHTYVDFGCGQIPCESIEVERETIDITPSGSAFRESMPTDVIVHIALDPSVKQDGVSIAIALDELEMAGRDVSEARQALAQLQVLARPAFPYQAYLP